MGQALKKTTTGATGYAKKVTQLEQIIEDCYDDFFQDDMKDWVDFYHAICLAVQKMNTASGNAQFRVPRKEDLETIFKDHHKGQGTVSKDKFREMLQKCVLSTELTTAGSKDFLFYIFGVPLVSVLIKQRFFPAVVPNDVFIPGVTSVTALALVKFNKI